MKTCFLFCMSLIICAESLAANTKLPVPLNGSYDMYLDRSKQTFNGHPVKTDRPLKQIEQFRTYCKGSDCSAHSLNKRPPPATFDYKWVNGHWKSVAGQQKQYIICNDGSKVESIKMDTITAKGNGSFSGIRVITVKGKGCPKDGAGKYRLPFTLTPRK